jgi:hypothetical protein
MDPCVSTHLKLRPEENALPDQLDDRRDYALSSGTQGVRYG